MGEGKIFDVLFFLQGIMHPITRVKIKITHIIKIMDILEKSSCIKKNSEMKKKTL